MKVTKGDRTVCSLDDWGHYLVGDFYVAAGDNGSYTLDDRVVKCVITIAHRLGLWKVYSINSTRRTAEYNYNLIVRGYNPAANSLHLTGQAIDFGLSPSTAAVLKSDWKAKGPIYAELVSLGACELIIEPTWFHIGVGKKAVFSVDNSGNKKGDIPVNSKIEKIKALPTSKDWYLYTHYDSSVTTVRQMLLDKNNPVSSNLNEADFLNYRGKGDISNLCRLWQRYTESQKNKFSQEYQAYTNALVAADGDQVQNIERDRQLIRPRYSASLEYDLPLGAILSIPKNKANLEIISVAGQNMYMEQQNLQAFQFDEFRKLMNDPKYIPTQIINVKNSDYTVNYLNLMFSCWVYVRSLDCVLDMTPFLRTMECSVGASGGTFSLVINDIFDLEEVKKYSETYYSYVYKTRGKDFDVSYFKKNLQQNDIVFIRYEQLDVETKRGNEKGLIIPFSELPGKTYDMIALVDYVYEGYSSAGNDVTINVNGRDLSKMLLEDGSYFYPLSLLENSPKYFANINKTDTFFKRTFSEGGKYEGNYFNTSFRSIRDSLGFIFNQLSNTGVLPKDHALFASYGDNRSKTYKVEGADQNSLKSVEQNGVWQIVKLVVDNQIDARRLASGELFTPEGPLMGLCKQICQEPFVEFWGDTMGDVFVFMARQPIFTKSAIQDYFANNSYITITSDVVSDISLNWETAFSTWYQLQPVDSLFGYGQSMSASMIPIVYLEEFVKVFGNHKKVVPDGYLRSLFMGGDQQADKVLPQQKSFINDLIYLVETNAILPWTRRGSVTIQGGDRRIKKGMWVLFEPTDEIMYVTSVSNSVTINGVSLSRTTQLQVERCMKREFVLGNSIKKLNGKNINYFDVVNIENIRKSILSFLKNEPSTEMVTVDSDLFDFFIKRKQW